MRVLVTILGAAGWISAVALIVGLRHAERPSTLTFDEATSTMTRLRSLAGRGAGSMVGCLAAGVLVMGLGGRLMMRVLAASSADGVQGAITDMDAVIGEVTVGGTFGFVAFVGAGTGVIGWMLRLCTRRWLPNGALAAGVVGAAIGAGALARGSSLLDPDSRDFELLTPSWLAVGLILALIVTLGMALGVLSDWLAEAWPTPGRGVSVLWASPLAALIIVPPIAVALGVATAVRLRLRAADTSPAVQRLDRAGRIVATVAAAAGAFWTLAAAVQILTS